MDEGCNETPENRTGQQGKIDDIFFARFLEFDTYHEMIEAVRCGETKMAAINSDVTAYQQRTWNDDVPFEQRLAVMKTFEKQIPWYMIIYGNYTAFLERNYDLISCFDDLSRADGFANLVRTAVFKYRQKVEVK